MYYTGCDLGSTTGKVVILDEGKNVLAVSVVRSARGPQKTFEHALSEALKQLPKEMTAEEFLAQTYVVTTGYGRSNIQGLSDEVSEISCHAKGATYLKPNVRTIIDIGGQDCKVISVSKEGNVAEFQMNDKCSAGTGRFFEVMCRVLDVSMDELAKEALLSNNPRQISKQCSVFAESEVISLINNNVSLADISAGIHDSIARRIHGMAFKVGIEEDVVLTGGCARNSALCKALEKRMKLSLVHLDFDPQANGALGAALFAYEHAKAREPRQ